MHWSKPSPWGALCCLILVAILTETWLVGQGSLTPDDPPGESMRTLLEIEPRIPLSPEPGLTHRFLFTAGSYYLTSDVEFIIIIGADNVTLDLNGFSMIGSNSGYGISVDNVKNVQIRNGTVRGFGSGIELSQGRFHVLEDLTLMDNANYGLTSSSTTDSIFRRIRILSNGNGSTVGLRLNGLNSVLGQNIIQNCVAKDNAGTAFSVQTSANLIISNQSTGSIHYDIAPGNRMGQIIFPTANAVQVLGHTGSTNSGTTDPFANLVY